MSRRSTSASNWRGAPAAGGNADGGVIARGDADIGPVASGEMVRIPFRFAPPRDIVRPFAGELIELFYIIRGRVDLPWAFDETAEAEVDLAASGLTGDIPGPAA